MDHARRLSRPLHVAAYWGNEKVARYLVELGAEVDQANRYSLLASARMLISDGRQRGPTVCAMRRCRGGPCVRDGEYVRLAALMSSVA